MSEIVAILNSTRMRKDTSLTNREDAIDYIDRRFQRRPNPLFPHDAWVEPRRDGA